jgi:hypothetical protein
MGTSLGISLCSSLSGERGGGLNRLAKRPPVLLRAESRGDSGGRETGAAVAVGNLMVLVRRTVGLM